MTNGQRPIKKLSQPGIYSSILACGWTLAFSLSLSVTTSEIRKGTHDIAVNIARAHIDKDVLFQDWNLMHGGIYVLVTPFTRPNPYLLRTVPERDITTPSGRLLTFMNPAYMTREIYEFAQKEKLISGHITSLKPLRPQNKPDNWETAALEAFRDGRGEVSEIVGEGDDRFMRLMRPLITETTCLACHSQQGYREGDPLGGISIRLPMNMFESSMREQINFLWANHISMWLLGLACMLGIGG